MKPNKDPTPGQVYRHRNHDPDDERQRIRAEILKLLTPTIDKAVEEIMNCRYRTQGTIEFVTKAVLKEMS